MQQHNLECDIAFIQKLNKCLLIVNSKKEKKITKVFILFSCQAAQIFSYHRALRDISYIQACYFVYITAG